MGANTLPCGTELLTLCMFDVFSLIYTYILRKFK